MHPPTPSASSPSPQQAAVYEFVSRSNGHAVVMATAGSGKTTTLVEVAHRLPAHTSACFLAFNRSTAAELRARLPPHVHATTIHALGRAALAEAVGGGHKVTLEPSKYVGLATGLLQRPPPPGSAGRVPDAAAYLAQLAHFARLDLIDPTNLPALTELKRRYSLHSPVAPPSEPALLTLLPSLIEAGREAFATAGMADFTDMVHLPLALGLEFPRFQFVCVDEAQDLSPMALGLVTRLVERGARALFVGDERQAIYAFAGADQHSLKRVLATMGAARLPLSVSFRCPRRHVALARRFSPEMTAAAYARAGAVRFQLERRLPRLARAGDLVMARTNAPLASTAMSLARAGKPVVVLGEDLASTLTQLANEIFPHPGPLARGAPAVVARHASAEAARLERTHLTDPDLAGHLERSALAHEGVLLVLAAAGARNSAPGRLFGAPLPRAVFERALLELFEHPDPRSAVVVSTIHKAKGREAERVFLLRPEELAQGSADELDPHELAAEQAEANVLFVALTRAKSELIFLERHAGAVTARLRANVKAHKVRPASLQHRWDDVLRLAWLMSGRPGRGPLPAPWLTQRPTAVGSVPRSS